MRLTRLFKTVAPPISAVFLATFSSPAPVPEAGKDDAAAVRPVPQAPPPPAIPSPMSIPVAERGLFLKLEAGLQKTPALDDFCQRFSRECTGIEKSPSYITLSAEAHDMLNRVNRYVNTHTDYESDMTLYNNGNYWTLPEKSEKGRWTGDCEDYALTKRKLLESVIPASAMMILRAEVRMEDGSRDYHAVLAVRTDQGDFILDNRTNPNDNSHDIYLARERDDTIFYAATDPYHRSIVHPASIQRDTRPADVQLRENVIGFNTDKPFVLNPHKSAPVLAKLMPADEKTVVAVTTTKPAGNSSLVSRPASRSLAEKAAEEARIVMTGQRFNYAEYERFCTENAQECESAAPERVTMTSALLSRLNSLNLTVNVNYKYKLDQENYGVPDRWTLPSDVSKWTGDCEDWALYKRKMLKDIVPAGAMSLAYVGFKDPAITSDHAVLVIRSDQGDYILDINDGNVVLMKDSPYVVKAMTDVADHNAFKVARLPARAGVQLASGGAGPQSSSP